MRENASIKIGYFCTNCNTGILFFFFFLVYNPLAIWKILCKCILGIKNSLSRSDRHCYLRWYDYKSFCKATNSAMWILSIKFICLVNPYLHIPYLLKSKHTNINKWARHFLRWGCVLILINLQYWLFLFFKLS